jgi:hypothetical protein
MWSKLPITRFAAVLSGCSQGMYPKFPDIFTIVFGLPLVHAVNPVIARPPVSKSSRTISAVENPVGL